MKIFSILKALARPRRVHNWFNPKVGFDNRPTSADVVSDGYGGMRKFLSTSDMVTNKPDGDGHIIQLDWDSTTNTWASQLFIPNGNGQPQFREQLGYSDWANGTQWYTILSDKNTADFIVEQGTSGIWTYRKWNSGVSECWGSYTNGSVTCNSSWGTLYEAKVTNEIAFPNGLFNSTPKFTCTVTGLACLLETTNGVSSTYTPAIWAVRPTTNTSAGVVANMHAIGTWK